MKFKSSAVLTDCELCGLFIAAGRNLLGPFSDNSSRPVNQYPHDYPILLRAIDGRWINPLGSHGLPAVVLTDMCILHISGIHDFLCLPEWTGSEVQEEPHLNVRSTLQRLPFYCTPSGAADAVHFRGGGGNPTLGGSFSFDVGDSDDESDGDNDACVEISLVTPLCFAAVIPSSGNQGGSSVAPATEDSWGKGIMIDDTVAPSIGKSQPRPSSQPAPSFRDVFGDAIHVNFFPFLFVLIMPPIPKVVLLRIMRFPRPGEMVRVESFSDDQLAAKMSVLHCMMMSHGCELLARYCGLNQSHHEYVLSTDSRLKGYEEKSKAKGKERKKKIKSLTKSLDNLHVEVAHLSANLNQATVLEAKKDEEILRLKATSSDWLNFMHGAQDRLADASLLVAQTDYAFLNKISKHVAEPLSVILHIEPEKLARPANVPPSRDARVYPPTTKESSVTPASKSLELSANVDLTAFVVASEHNEDMVNAEVDGLNPNMTDDIVVAKSRHTFVQGISVALEDVVELVKVGLSLVCEAFVGFFWEAKHQVSFMRILRLREVARMTARIALEFAPDYAFSVSLLLTPLCCDDIHDVTPRVSALAGCDRLVSEPLVIEKVEVWEQNRVLAGFGIGGKIGKSKYEYEIRYHPSKANVVIEALRRKERVKPRRVRAMAMTIQYEVRGMILAAQSEAFKQENAEIGESSLIGPELVQETTDKLVLIKEKLKAARDRQKSCADNRRKPLEFETEVDKTLRSVEELVENSDCEVMRLKCSRIVIVKVRFWLEARSLRLQGIDGLLVVSVIVSLLWIVDSERDRPIVVDRRTRSVPLFVMLNVTVSTW
ncbi:hypothetical protein Tco_0952285 [Tanacetum coccineum]|uniref:Uncharacterized protein n=1 Tax=Tanacetum coccineum TaxID=301880 RepID=A0ABQ5DWY0_9ASTR